MQSDIHKHYGLLLAREQPVSADIIKQCYLGVKESEKSLLEVFDLHNFDKSGEFAIPANEFVFIGIK